MCTFDQQDHIYIYIPGAEDTKRYQSECRLTPNALRLSRRAELPAEYHRAGGWKQVWGALGLDDWGFAFCVPYLVD